MERGIRKASATKVSGFVSNWVYSKTRFCIERPNLLEYIEKILRNCDFWTRIEQFRIILFPFRGRLFVTSYFASTKKVNEDEERPYYSTMRNSVNSIYIG